MFGPRVARRLLAAALAVTLVATLGACGQAGSASEGPLVSGVLPPYVEIDSTWTATGGHWTFTGYVNPLGYATDVLLDVGEGTPDAMKVENTVPVSQQVTLPGPITVTTGAIPKVATVCVRFDARNQFGSSPSKAICFPYTPPTPAPPAAPTVMIQTQFTAINGAWTFGATVDPQRSPTDVVLEIGRGPLPNVVYTSQLVVQKAVMDAGPLMITTKDLPNVATVCVRFVATNAVGKTNSDPLCFSR